MAGEFDALIHKVESFTAELDGAADQARLKRVGQAVKPKVADAVRATLGDDSMSGWRRGRPIQIDGRYEVRDSGLEVVPGKRSAGLMRVLEAGRNAGRSGPTQGPLIPTFKKNGQLSKRQKKHKRWNGSTAGKGTWTDAERRVTDEATKVYKAEVDKAFIKFFGG